MFSIPRDWESIEPCKCCEKKALLLGVEAALTHLGELAALDVRKGDDTENGGDDFLPFELAIAALLSASWEDKSEIIEKELLAVASTGGILRLSDFSDVLQNHSQKMLVYFSPGQCMY